MANIELAVVCVSTLFWSYLHIKSRGESIPSGLLAWLSAWGMAFYWIASKTELPAIAWLFIIYGLVPLLTSVNSLIEWNKLRKSE